MKRRLSAVLLALGLTASAFSAAVCAQETEAPATEQAAEAGEGSAEEELSEAESELAEAVSEAEAAAEGESEAQTEAQSQEDQIKEVMGQYLTQIAAYTDEQIEMMLESDDVSTARIASNWNSVKEELGGFVEVTSAEISEDGASIVCHAKYEKINDKTDVTVTYTVDQAAQTVVFSWDIDYPMGTLMLQALGNTVVGIAIVFLVLVFLSWLIGKLHIIPDMLEKRSAAKNPAPAPAPAPVQETAAAVVEEEEDLTDDLELVAVITAAIAASETTSGDGFVVRSIKKANKRNWQRA